MRSSCPTSLPLCGVGNGLPCAQHLNQSAPLLPAAAYAATLHPDYALLAGRICVSNLHKKTNPEFAEVAQALRDYVHPKVSVVARASAPPAKHRAAPSLPAQTGAPAPLMSAAVNDIVQANKERLQAAIDYDRDYMFDFFGFKTLERSYLLKMHGKIAERPQHMYMRVALGIHGEDVDAAIETYNLMSLRYFTHATPTLFNAGTDRPQLSSCFLLTMKGDSIDGIYDTLKQCACISKFAGGIGLSIHNIRATDSYIRGTNGSSNGIVPMLRVFSNTARYVDQGGGKRKGSFAVYLEPWHADILSFLDLKKNHGKEEARARDLFYALWVPDLFMKRVQAGGTWTLMCPNECPGLADCWGDEFEALYEKYEAEGRGRKTMDAQKLWYAVLDSQIETGTPYILYKDACNRKSNQQHLGTIKSSNLCTEIVEYTAPDEVAVCNLASIALPMFVKDAEEGEAAAAAAASTGSKVFDFELLERITRVATKNLNKVIDVNYYPVPEARKSNMRHRPVGIGVQGLADVFALMRMPFDSPEAKALNRDIFETMYYGAVAASIEVAAVDGPYETYEGSPASQGKLQFDLWGVTPSERHDWAGLKAELAKHGMRNSLLLAPMPTASTAQILGNNEATEPFTSNIYNRRVLAGDFTVVNKHMMRDLIALDMWTPEIRNLVIAHRGSIQNIPGIPDHIKALYKTVWEIKQRVLLDMAADRAPFICQSQSMNLHIADPTHGKLTGAHFHSWKLGLKTGMYYLRTRPKADAIQFTVDQQLAAQTLAKESASAASSKAVMPATPPRVPSGSDTISPSQDPAGSASKPAACVWRPKHLRDDEECLMCGS